MNKRQRKKLYLKLRRHKVLNLRERIIAINYGSKEFIRRRERGIIRGSATEKPKGILKSFAGEFVPVKQEPKRAVIYDELAEWTADNYKLIGIVLGHANDTTVIFNGLPGDKKHNDAVDALVNAYKAERIDG